MRSKNRPLRVRQVAAWLFAFVLLCSGSALAGPQDDHLLQSPAGEHMSYPPKNEKYTVQLGTFQTVPAMNDLYLQVPPKNLKKTLVCRSGVHYTLRCGSSAKKKDISPVFKEFNDLGLKPVIVKADLTNCTPAEAFFDAYGREKIGAVPQQAQLPAKKEGVYADLLDPRVKRYLEGGRMSILPEVATKVLLSNRDVNRVTCMNGPIKDIIYSKEKGITVKTDGNNAFVKFLISRDPATGNLLYAKIPSELYVVCGSAGTVYTLIASPRDIPAQTVELVSHKKDIKENLSLFEGIPFEKKVLLLVKDAYRDAIPESFTVQVLNQQLNIFRDIDVSLKREVIADGEGLDLKEYVLALKSTSTKVNMPLMEKFFLLPELARNPVGIALERMTLKKGRTARLFIVEKHVD
jgi:conjugal transfer pilus assembly protein TraK